MKRKKIHIDELFRNGLKSLSLFVSNKDLEAIDEKKNIFNSSNEQAKDSVFNDFELEVNEADWLATKAKLDLEKSAMAQDNIFASGLSEMELEVPRGDWTKTYDKYKQAKKKRVVFTWLVTGVVVLLLSIVGISSLVSNTSNQNQTSLNGGASSDQTIIDKPKIDVKSDTPINNKLLEGNESELNLNQSIKSNSSEQTNVKTTKTQLPILNNEGSKSIDNKLNSELLKQADDQSKELSNIENIIISEEQEFLNSNKLNNANMVESNETVDLKDFDKVSNSAENTEESIHDETDKVSSSALDSDIRLGEAVIDTPEVSSDLNPKPIVPKFHLYAGIVNQISLTHRKLDKNNPEFYNSVRNNGEEPFIQNSFGLEFGVQKNGLQISGGVQSTSQKWSTSYNYSYTVFDSLPVWNPGRTQIIGYFLVRGRDTSINEQNEIKISKVQFPIEVSGLFKLNDKLQLIAGGGLLFSMNTSTTGTKILNPVNMQLYNYSILEEKERRFNVSPSLNFGIQKNFGKHFLFQSNVSGNMALQSRFKNSFGAKDYPYSIGVNFKLLYILK
ncbi:MAG: hypothetical protein R2852_05950 [Bacteroidia bacterium]